MASCYDGVRYLLLVEGRSWMNITKVEQYVRVLALPVGCVLLGLFFGLIAGAAKDSLYLASAAGYLAVGGFTLAAGGLLWSAWSLFQMERWENGAVIGTCPKCGGAESNLDGKYGPYSRCKMCGAKREGW